MTKQDIKTAILDCTKKLGRAPNRLELTEMTGVTRHAIRTYFRTFNGALRQCQLKPSHRNSAIDLSALFRDWAKVARELKKLPTATEYRNLGLHSEYPLCNRFGSWHEVPYGFRAHAKEHGWHKKYADVLRMIAKHLATSSYAASDYIKPLKPKLLLDRPVFGPVMHNRQMAHGPINESGVIYLFGSLAERLGFVVMRIQNGFPDCAAMRRIDKNRWQLVNIEFEFESRNFLKHQHPVKGCDVIVCWEHNWPECPLEVIELSRLVPRL